MKTRMHKLRGTALRLAFVGAVTGSPFMAPLAAETLTYGSPVSEQALFNREGVIPFLKRIESETDGRVKFRGLFGGTVVQINSTLAAIEDGVVDSGFLILGFYASDLPAASVMSELTGLGTDPVASMGALNEVFFSACPDCLDDMKASGQIPLFLNTTSPTVMQCTSVVSGASDLTGKRVSVVGNAEARWANALGMSPVRTSIGDLLISLETGKTDCALVPLSWAKSYGLADVVKGVIDMPQGISAGAVPVSISLDAWNEISEDDRAAILSVAADTAYPYVMDAYVGADAAVRTDLEAVASFASGDAAMAEAWTGYQEGEVANLEKLASERGFSRPCGFRPAGGRDLSQVA